MGQSSLRHLSTNSFSQRFSPFPAEENESINKLRVLRFDHIDPVLFGDSVLGEGAHYGAEREQPSEPLYAIPPRSLRSSARRYDHYDRQQLRGNGQRHTADDGHRA